MFPYNNNTVPKKLPILSKHLNKRRNKKLYIGKIKFELDTIHYNPLFKYIKFNTFFFKIIYPSDTNNNQLLEKNIRSTPKLEKNSRSSPLIILGVGYYYFFNYYFFNYYFFKTKFYLTSYLLDVYLNITLITSLTDDSMANNLLFELVKAFVSNSFI